MNADEKRVLDAIDYDGMYIFLEELVYIPSYGGDESKAQWYMAKTLEEHGYAVDKWKIDFQELSKHPNFSMSYEREEGVGVVGVKGEGDRALMLCGHIDTVVPGDISNWDTIPLVATRKDGRIYGRGTNDMKGGIAAALFAAKAVTDNVKLKGKLLFASCIGEEDGSPGALATALRYKADAGIIMEPSETKLAPKVAGAISFKITVPGKSVHACVKDEGISAIDKFIVIHQGLKELENERNKRLTDPDYSRYASPYAISIGVINGGQWAGTVPEKVVFEGRIGVAVGEAERVAMKDLEDKINEIADGDSWLRANRPTVAWDGYNFASSMVPKDHPIVEAIAGALRDVTGEEPVYEGMTYASDARHLINVGDTPTTVFGPGDIRVAHGPNEYVPVKDMETTVKTLALAIMRFLGHE
ncbi:ArgE/DapE family deacylase [Candidatus Bathyarchaeota archaeon]|nr:ArgE/DapE family deacylase [Candidatus Bathyarchaeota archaeon]